MLRFTREATRPPYGLIDNEVDVRLSLDEADTTHEGEEADSRPNVILNHLEPGEVS